MIKSILGLTLFTYAVLVQAAAEIPDYPAQKISEHVYVIPGPLALPNPKNKGFINNPVFVITTTGVVVLDPGSSLYTGRMVLRQIRKLSNKPVTHVFNSHIHGDHWLGNQAFIEAYPQVKILAHPQMIAQAKAGGGEMWVKTMASLTHGASKGTRPVYPAVALRDGQIIKNGGLSFRVYLTEYAHTRTDAMIEVIEDSVMVVGDNALYKRIGRMDDGSFLGNIAAIDRALAAGTQHYIPGHGPSGGAEVIRPYKTYLQSLYQEVSNRADQGQADYEMKAAVHTKLKAFHEWSGYQHELGRHISLAMLEWEQAGF